MKADLLADHPQRSKPPSPSSAAPSHSEANARLTPQWGFWAVGVAEASPDSDDYTVHIKSPTHYFTLTRSQKEIIELHSKLRDYFPIATLPAVPLASGTTPHVGGKHRTSFLHTLSRLATNSPTTPSDIYPARFPLLSVEPSVDPFALGGVATSILQAYLTSVANDQICQNARPWKGFMRIRPSDMESVGVGSAIDPAANDAAIHAITPAAEQLYANLFRDVSISSIRRRLEEELSSIGDFGAHSLGRSPEGGSQSELEKGLELASEPSKPSPAADVTGPEDADLGDDTATSTINTQVSSLMVAPSPSITSDSGLTLNAMPESETPTQIPASIGLPGPHPSSHEVTAQPTIETEGHLAAYSEKEDDSGVKMEGGELLVVHGPVVVPATQDMETPPDVIDGPSPTDDIGEEVEFDALEPFDTRGHFCDLFLGTHRTAGVVALKRLRDRGGGEQEVKMLARQFQRETDIWMQLRHDHILKCLGGFRRNRRLYLVSPFMKNGSLYDWLRSGRHEGLERLRLIHELAGALVYLHSSSIVHGDVKANNVLLSDDFHVQLCDFGLTKLAESNTSTTLKGAGSVRWQAPELWNNQPKTVKSDVYAFAMTVVEILTSQVPFESLINETTVVIAVLTQGKRPIQSPKSSPDGTSYSTPWLVAEGCWNGDPDQRITMADALKLLILHAETAPV